MEGRKLCVDRREAAAMVNLSPKAFARAVNEGRFPGPTLSVGRTKLWAVKALEQAVDQMAGIEAQSTDLAKEALGKWRRNRAMSSVGR